MVFLLARSRRVPREWTGSQHREALLPCLTGAHCGTGMEPRVHTEDWTRLRTVQDNSKTNCRITKLLLSGGQSLKGNLLDSFPASPLYHPHTSYPGPVVCLTSLKLAIIEQSLTMKTFFSSTVWKRPWPNLEVVSINLRSIFSWARRLVCTSRDWREREQESSLYIPELA